MRMNPKIDESVLLDSTAKVGLGTRIWHNSQIRDQVKIGNDCVIGRNVYIGSGVEIGSNCKIQNNALIYEPALIGDGVFIGPGAILTNDHYPRAVNPDLTLKSASDWDSVGVSIHVGASIGAGVICVAPIEIGRWALIAAGSVVTKDVPDFGLFGGVPARQIGWVGKFGLRLVEQDGLFVCPVSHEKYEVIGPILKEVD